MIARLAERVEKSASSKTLRPEMRSQHAWHNQTNIKETHAKDAGENNAPEERHILWPFNV